MTVNWRHRIVRVPEGDVEQQRDAVIAACADGWIYDAQEHGEGETVDLVFRRALPQAERIAWT